MQNYPALLDLTTQKPHAIGVSESFLVGRNDTADICVLDVTCSRHHFRIVRRDGQYFVEPLNSLNHTYCNGNAIAHATSLEHGDILQAGQTRFQFLQKPGGATKANHAAVPIQELSIGVGTKAENAVLGSTVFSLGGVMTIGREQATVQIHLPHPQVSRRHACIAINGTTAILTDLNSANGTFVNSRRITGATTLQPGDQLDIGPFALQFTGTSLIPRPRSDNVELIARNISRIVKNRENGEPMTLLDGINLVIRPREFVCLLGPSGSGKSTLLETLSGRATPDSGNVFLNDKDLHAGFDAVKQDIAVVPQKDVLHNSLAVEQALWYTAKLRLPPDTSAAEIETSLAEMFETVGLNDRRATAIRNLSGGQVKRASLANEILCKPSLLFLDEVTSGLDEQTDREVMNLFRSLADAGKTVVCVTHSLVNVERTCHLVVILTPGGKLAFVGKPAEALAYFKIERLGDVYEILKAPKPTPEQLREDPRAASKLAKASAERWQKAFLESPLWRHYVGDRLPIESNRAIAATSASADRTGGHLRLFARQTMLLTRRYAAIWRGDYLSLLAMAAQSIVVALLLGVLFGNLETMPRESPQQKVDYAGRSVSLMFLLAISSFWFGCNNAAKEIVKERTIYTRERDFNLRVSSYYASKLLLLTAFSWSQTLMLFLIVRLWCGPPGPLASELIVLLALAFAGVTMGLAVSALATTEEMAITLIPMVVIPQIILSGTISPIEGWSKLLAQVCISTYWGKRGLDACMPENVANAVMPRLEQGSTALAVLILLAHAAAGIAFALAVLYWQNRRGRSRA